MPGDGEPQANLLQGEFGSRFRVVHGEFPVQPVGVTQLSAYAGWRLMARHGRCSRPVYLSVHDAQQRTRATRTFALVAFMPEASNQLLFAHEHGGMLRCTCDRRDE